MNQLRDGMIREMEVMSASLPDEVAAVEFDQLDTYIASNFPAQLPQAAERLGLTVCPEDLIDDIRSTMVNVALTPWGNADSPLDGQFVQPCQVQMTVNELLACLLSNKDGLVFYMQSQDDNLNKEFSQCSLLPRDIDGLKQHCPLLAKRGKPEASNLWIGGPRTTSRLHNDHYDNIFVQLSGSKRIFLIPPSHVYGVHEQFLVPQRYQLESDCKLRLIDDEELNCKVLFPTVDPRDLKTQDDSFKYCKVYVIDLHPGDALFIPSLWYHQVEIISEEINISVNYWYTPPSQSPLWPMWDFMRMSSLVIRGYYDKDYFLDDGDEVIT